ncbi:MAG: hypothetical protein LBC62_07830 [Treponema sp.]|jgi:hypothetical protein|nr:hypothetical protein [Treponema sp.]
MAADKKPSIYYDRGTIGSSDELDEYGVWVKSEPQDLTPPGAESGEEPEISGELSEAPPDLPDLDIPVTEDFSDIGDLPDFDAAEENSPDFEENPEENISAAEEEFGETTEDFSFNDDFNDDIADTIEDGIEGDIESDIEDTIEVPDMETEDESPGELPDFGIPEDAPIKDEDDSPEALGFTEISFDGFPAGEAGSPEAGSETEEFAGSLDLPLEIAPEAPVELTEAPSGEAPEKTPSGGAGPDLSTQLLMKIADELSSIRNELTSLKKDFAGLKAENPGGGQDRGFFNEEEDDEKIALTGDEMNNILNPESGEPQENAGDEPSGRGFFDEEDDETIALTGDELDNILNTANFTEEAGADATEDLADNFNLEETEEPFPEEAPVEEAVETEESPGDEPPEDITADLDLDMNLEEQDLDELGGEINLDQEINLDSINPESGESIEESFDTIDLNLPEDEELRKLMEEGAEPMTPAPEPEDSSYLAEDPLAEDLLDTEQFDEEPLDLSGAVIEEPDLSSDIQDNPIQEPSLDDISIDLDIDEDSLDSSSEEENAEETEEFNLDTGEEIELHLGEEDEEEDVPVSPEPLRAEEPPFEDVDLGMEDDLALIPEGFVVEADDAREGGGDSLADDSLKEEEPFTLAGEEPEEAAEEATEATIEETVVEEIPEKDNSVSGPEGIPQHLKQELRTVLSYMDHLLESLPDEKIEEFARSDYFDTYKKLFKELGLV